MGKLLFKGFVQHRQGFGGFTKDFHNLLRMESRILKIHITCQKLGSRIQIIGKETACKLDFVRVFLEVSKDSCPGGVQSLRIMLHGRIRDGLHRFVNVRQVCLGVIQKLLNFLAAWHGFHINARDPPVGFQQKEQPKVDADAQQDTDNQVPVEE